jgi:hypothetical protein
MPQVNCPHVRDYTGSRHMAGIKSKSRDANQRRFMPMRIHERGVAGQTAGSGGLVRKDRELGSENIK